MAARTAALPYELLHPANRSLASVSPSSDVPSPLYSPMPPFAEPPPVPGSDDFSNATMAESDRISNQSNKSTKAPSYDTGASSSQHSSLSGPTPAPPGTAGAAGAAGGAAGTTAAAAAAALTARRYNPDAHPRRRLRSQYPRGSTEKHVEYILVASFDVLDGPVMEHQYPVAITGDENMLSGLMLPDQTHMRNQDWTMFFLHKDTTQEEEEQERLAKEERRRRRQRKRARMAGLALGDDEVAEEQNGFGEKKGRRRKNGNGVGHDGDGTKGLGNGDGLDSDSHGEDDEAGSANGWDNDGNDDLDDGGYDDDDLDDDDVSTDSEPEGGEGAPLIYVLNLVNTKKDPTKERGAVVRSMAICTRHPFLHIYKPLLLLALEEYFRSPVVETLALLYDAVNAMDLSLMPRLSLLERNLLQASDNKDLFVEKFERMIQMRIAEEKNSSGNDGGSGSGSGSGSGGLADQPLDASRSPPKPAGILRAGTKAHFEGRSAGYSVPRDTHEFESRVLYKGIPIPVKVPTAVMPETVGDFSLIKLIQNFAEPHAKSPQAFQLHAHLTTNGPLTHPIIVLVNALLTQKRIVFLGHNMPSGEVAEAVLAACALASGGLLRGFTRHAFPYTDLGKVEALQEVPGFIAGVTNPTFELHPEWWDLLCDLPSGRMRISSRIEEAPVTEGLQFFKQKHPAVASLVGTSLSASVSSANSDLTGDNAFMADILKSVAARLGERVIRAKWRDWVVKFTRIAAAFEESVYGASVLNMGTAAAAFDGDAAASTASGHGYVWPDETAKQRDLAGNVTRIEGWRNTRSYQSFIKMYTVRPLKGLDLHHMHDRLRTQRLTPAQSRDIYLTFARRVHSYDEICLLLSVAPEAHGGLFYVALGLFHKDRDVRVKTSELLERIGEHEAGQHWWRGLSRFEKLAFARIRREAEAEMRSKLEREGFLPPGSSSAAGVGVGGAVGGAAGLAVVGVGSGGGGRGDRAITPIGGVGSVAAVLGEKRAS